MHFKNGTFCVLTGYCWRIRRSAVSQTHDVINHAAKLGALLRLAEYLDRSRTQVVRSIRCRIQDASMQLLCQVRGDAATEVWATQRNAELFKQAFKREVIVQTRTLKNAEGTAQPIGAERATTPTVELLWARVQEIIQLLKTRSQV